MRKAIGKMRLKLVTIVHMTIEYIRPGNTTDQRIPALRPLDARPVRGPAFSVALGVLSNEGVPWTAKKVSGKMSSHVRTHFLIFRGGRAIAGSACITVVAIPTSSHSLPK